MSLLQNLNQRPIAYYPVYKQVTGSTTAAILLSQLMYWFAKKDVFHKTDVEIISETMLSESELRSAKNNIKKLGFIKVSVKGVPAKTYYEIDWQIYETSLVKFTELNPLNSLNCDSEIHETYIVKSLTKTTTKTTTEKRANSDDEVKEQLPHEQINYEKILEVYNHYADKYNLPKLKAITQKRRAKLLARYKDNKNFKEILNEAFKKIGDSSFLLGTNSRGWKIDFDWLIENDTNAIKICEDKYQDKEHGEWK